MKINGEPVEAVRALTELRIGTTVYYRPCGHCAAPHHRMMALRRVRVLTGMLPTGEEGVPSGGWVCAPAPRCIGNLAFVATERSVALGLIFRVVDPLLDAGTKTATRKPVEAKT